MDNSTGGLKPISKGQCQRKINLVILHANLCQINEHIEGL